MKANKITFSKALKKSCQTKKLNSLKLDLLKAKLITECLKGFKLNKEREKNLTFTISGENIKGILSRNDK